MPGDDPLADASTAIVGGGIGGLATACYLADRGADVTLYERGSRLGGSVNLLEREGFRFDTGPTWYLMPDVFERFFDHFGRSPDDYYDLTRLDPHYRAFFKANAGPRPTEAPAGITLDPDGDVIDVPADRDRLRAIFEAYEDGGGEALDRYLATAEESYRIGMERFVYEDRPRFRDYLDLDVARSARGLTFLGTMDDHVAGYVDHPKLRQLLQYTLVFLGGAPSNTPALYNLMSHVDANLGVYYPEGGMYAVVEALADLGRELGVEYHTDSEVTAIRNGGKDVRVEVADRGDEGTTTGETHRADAVVCNANPAHVDRDLLPEGTREYREGYWDSRTYAPSAFMLYLGVEGECPDLAHHTLVLPEDWDAHFQTIFDEPAWPEDPAYYLCVPSRTDDAVAPDGHEAIVVLVPIAPGLDDGPEVRERYRRNVLDDLTEHAGVDLRDRIVVEERACVSEFADRLRAPGGSALGLAHTLRQTGPFRPGHRSSALEGLYYVGAYTTPGIGVPMCLISGEHAADAVTEDLAGRSMSERVAGALPLVGD